jgi:hypothetical protein
LIVSGIRHKFVVAEERKQQSQEKLSTLLSMVNPFVPGPSNYTSEFFKSQWSDQVDFQKTHSDAETERNERLALFFERERMLDQLR